MSSRVKSRPNPVCVLEAPDSVSFARAVVGSSTCSPTWLDLARPQATCHETLEASQSQARRCQAKTAPDLHTQPLCFGFEDGTSYRRPDEHAHARTGAEPASRG